MMAVIAALVVWKPADGPLADPDMFFFVFLRGMVIFSTIYNIWSSDRMHNLDLACTEQQHCCEETKRQEFIYWQHDEVSISMIMTTTFMLWNSNMWTFDMGRMLSAVSCGATCLVWLLSKSKTAAASASDLALGAKRTQGLMGIQFFVCFGWMVAHVLANNENMRFYTLIWFAYLPGVLSFAIKSFNQKLTVMGPDGSPVTVCRSVLGLEHTWGLHEVFHVSVICGHVLSAGMDVYLISAHRHSMHMHT